MTNIQTRAYFVDKPNKARARWILEQLYEQSPDGAYAELYKWFEVVPPKRPKSLEDWVNLARSSEAVRPQLNHTYYDGEHLIATDGYRLHRYKCKMPQVGYYHADGTHMHFDNETHMKFPETSRLFPDTVYSREFNIDEICEGIDKNHYRLNIFNTVYHVRKKHLDDLMFNDETATIFTNYNDGKSRLNFYFNQERDGLLMPINPNKI